MHRQKQNNSTIQLEPQTTNDQDEPAPNIKKIDQEQRNKEKYSNRLLNVDGKIQHWPRIHNNDNNAGRSSMETP